MRTRIARPLEPLDGVELVLLEQLERLHRETLRLVVADQVEEEARDHQRVVVLLEVAVGAPRLAVGERLAGAQGADLERLEVAVAEAQVQLVDEPAELDEHPDRGRRPRRSAPGRRAARRRRRSPAGGPVREVGEDQHEPAITPSVSLVTRRPGRRPLRRCHGVPPPARRSAPAGVRQRCRLPTVQPVRERRPRRAAWRAE